jgi:hypothetical protein
MGVCPRSGRGWLLVGQKLVRGEAAVHAAGEVSKVQVAGPRMALTPLVMFHSESLQFTSSTASPSDYPKRYPPLSEWIVSRAVSTGYHEEITEYAPAIRHRNFWHGDCRQLGNWPLGPTNTCGTQSRSVGFKAQQVFSPALPLSRSPGDSR